MTRHGPERIYDGVGKMPQMTHAGDYSSTMHYLKAVQAAGTDEAQAVMQKMRELPLNDFFAKNGRVRADGLMEHDLLRCRLRSLRRASENGITTKFLRQYQVVKPSGH